MQGCYNVLFLCTGNSARSIMAEAIMNQKGKPAFAAYSAGSYSAAKVRSEALRQLEAAHVPTAGLRSKSWGEFAKAGAPKLDLLQHAAPAAVDSVGQIKERIPLPMPAPPRTAGPDRQAPLDLLRPQN